MFEGETADCLALANTAILMRLIEQLIEHGVIARASLINRQPNADLDVSPSVRYWG